MPKYTSPPETKHFECRDCGGKFDSATEYSNHFIRAEHSIDIVGCSKKAQPATAN